jgi:hypothetical protein
MRYHDILAGVGVAGLVIGAFLVIRIPGLRLVGAVVALAGLGLLAYAASFL